MVTVTLERALFGTVAALDDPPKWGPLSRGVMDKELPGDSTNLSVTGLSSLPEGRYVSG